MGAYVQPEWEQLAAESSAVLLAGLSSDDWARARDRFGDWLSEVGQTFYANDLAQLTGRQESCGEGSLTGRRWNRRLREALEESEEQVGPAAAEALRRLVKEFSSSGAPGGPVAAAPDDGSFADDHIDFRQGSFHGPVVAVQHNYGAQPGGGHLGPHDWPAAKNIEPLTLGTRATSRVPGLPRLPPYVPRSVDGELAAVLRQSGTDGGLVVVRGEPFAGKTRTALAVMAEVLANHPVFVPAVPDDLRELSAMVAREPGRCVVWLDDLDGHLGGSGVEPRLLGRLTGLGVTVLATLREEAYDELRQSARGRVLDLAHIIELPRKWSTEERQRATETGDERLVEAARRSGPEGVAAYLAVGPLLWDEWQRASRADRHPRAYALVRAAVDLARCGLRGPLSQDLLVMLHEGLEAVSGREKESVDEALAWAAEKRHGVMRMLRRHGARMWEAAPYLVDTALKEEGFPAADGVVWGFALEEARENTAYDFETVVGTAREAFRRAAEAGDGRAMLELGLLAETFGEGAEAEEWFRRATEAASTEAAGRLGRLLVERGDTLEAEPFLETAADAGDAGAATLLGKLLRERSRTWLAKGAEGQDAEAAHLLADLLLGSGDFDEAEKNYWVAERLGRAEVARSVGMFYLIGNAGRAAEIWLGRARAAGDELAGDIMEWLDDGAQSLEDADGYFRESTFVLDHANKGVLREKQGLLDEARSLYESGYDAGDPYGAYRLAALLISQGKTDEALTWYRKAADMGHPGAKQVLAETPDTAQTPDTVENPDTVKE